MLTSHVLEMILLRSTQFLFSFLLPRCLKFLNGGYWIILVRMDCDQFRDQPRREGTGKDGKG